MSKIHPARRERPALFFLSAKWRCAALISMAALALPVMARLTPTLLPPTQAALPRIQLNAGIHLIHAEVADTDASRSLGLMFRESLGASEGMLFVFQRRDIQCFWMRNTLIPLSIAFLNEEGGVVNLSDMAPQTETAHCSTQPVRYALEMNQHWFTERGIGTQSVIEGLSGLAGIHQK